MAEVTQEQIRAQQLVESLWNDGELGQKIQAKAKDMFSDIKTTGDLVAPFIDEMKKQNAALQERLDAMAAERETERKKAEESAAENQKKSFETAIQSARDSYNLTDEGFDKMVARMKETGNYTDPEAAAAWVASKTPPAPVSGPTFGPQDLNLFGSSNADENMAALHRNPEKYMDMQLSEFIRDPDRYVRETFAQ